MANERSDSQQERRMLVLRTVVDQYMSTHEPVGSSTVARLLPVKASSATVRNDMAALEDDGYLVQPHTSAGRVPTQRGYRLYVDRLVHVAPLTAAQMHAITDVLSRSVSLEDTLRLSVRLLAKITGQVAIVASPKAQSSSLRRFELVRLAWNAYLMVIITDSGRVEQSTLVSEKQTSAELVDEVMQRINEMCVGKPLTAIPRACVSLATSTKYRDVAVLLAQVAHAIHGISVDSDSLYMAGTSALARRSDSSARDLASLFDALEEQVVVLRLLSTVSQADNGTGVGVAIGSETHTDGLQDVAVVSSGYGDEIISAHDDTSEATSTNSDNPEEEGKHSGLAFVGSIGPTHMNYPNTMAAVKAVAQYLSSIIGQQEV